MQGFKLTIIGAVQGVGYRRWFEKQAVLLGLKGYVKNLSDGNVEAVVVGTEDQLKQIIEQSWQGPTRAVVEDIQQEVLRRQEMHYVAFSIQR